MSQPYDMVLKIIVVGDKGVGKTALINQFRGSFSDEMGIIRFGLDFHVKSISVDTNTGPKQIKLQIWEFSEIVNQEPNLQSTFYRGTNGAIILFDLTNSSSFNHLPSWIEEINEKVGTNIPLLLVGTKSDLIGNRAVSLGDINRYSQNQNLHYVETSAKTNINIGECFDILARLMIEKYS
ncbi:MAG: Rab family GTPase [Candidatus Thorarchaeota archaeon]